MKGILACRRTVGFAFCLLAWPLVEPLAADPGEGILEALALSDFAGAYAGTFSGDDRGTWQFEVDRRGVVTGGGLGTEGRFTASGRVSEGGNLRAVAGSTDEGTTFRGTIDRDGRVRGTWENRAFRESGTFRGQRIVLTRRLRIEVRSFVPGDFVSPSFAPRRCDGQVVHAGDDRIDRRGRARFSASSGKFRTRQRIDLVIERSGRFIDFDVGTKSNKAAKTKEYALNALEDGVINKRDNEAGRNDCHRLNRVKKTSVENLRITRKDLVTNRTRLRLRGTLPNPHVRLAPAIDWDFRVEITVTGDRTSWRFSGKHDGFPAFEAYIAGQPMYQFDPGGPACELDVAGTTVATYCPGQVAKLGGRKEVVAGPRTGVR